MDIKNERKVHLDAIRGSFIGGAAVTGNILGALLGYDAIEDKWKENLECKEVILEMEDDICYGCQMSEMGSYFDEVWYNKYMR